MRYEDSAGGKLYENLLSHAFTIHPYRQPVIGYARDINRLTATMLTDFHHQYYAPSNIAIGLVGDVDPSRDRRVIERFFGRIPAGPTPPRPTIVEPPQQQERRFSVEFDAAPEVVLAYRKTSYPHPDDPPVSVLAEILAGSAISPLYEELVLKQRIASSVGFSEAPGSVYPNLLMFSIDPRVPHTADEAIAAFDAVLAQVRASGVSEEQLSIAQRAIAMQYLGQLKGNQSLAVQLSLSTLIYGDWRALARWYDEAMAVTVSDVNRVLHQYLNPETRTVGVIKTAARTSPRSNSKARSDAP